MLIFALIAAIALPPKPDHYVTDRAGVITNAKALDDKLAQFERDTSDQILIYVDQHLPPDSTIEEMGSEAIKTWAVGQKGKDNGAILFVFIGDRKMRIEVGYGLEGALTDAKSKRIIETVIKPHFQNGDYSTGINDGVSAILAAIRGEPFKGTGVTVAQRRVPEVTIPFWGCCVAMVGSIGLLALIAWLANRGNKGYTISSGSYGGSSSSWSSSSSTSLSYSSSSSSSSSVSGGGGSGGGGGASGSW